MDQVRTFKFDAQSDLLMVYSIQLIDFTGYNINKYFDGCAANFITEAAS